MWRLILILLPAVIAPAALASEAPAGPPSVLVGREICRRLVAHRPAPDVLYRPGVNLRGRPVAPADIDRPPLELPAEIGVDILVPWPDSVQPGIARPEARRRPDAPPVRYRGEVYVGLVTLAPDGSLLFNGRPLSGPEQDHLSYFCREAARRRW